MSIDSISDSKSVHIAESFSLAMSLKKKKYKYRESGKDVEAKDSPNKYILRGGDFSAILLSIGAQGQFWVWNGLKMTKYDF